uniref:Uncharacterized protein n=1 Tax=Rhipicephalus appendiculatus TaxID=34631 RepID=A0A131YDZ9_RHIAP
MLFHLIQIHLFGVDVSVSNWPTIGKDTALHDDGWGFTLPNHNMIMRRNVVEGSGNRDHVGFFNAHLNLSTLVSSTLPPSKCGHYGWDTIPRPSGQTQHFLSHYIMHVHELLSLRTSASGRVEHAIQSCFQELRCFYMIIASYRLNAQLLQSINDCSLCSISVGPVSVFIFLQNL